MSFDPPARKSVGDGSLTAVDWLLCIFCSGIGCIIGIVRLAQGDPRGGKMIGISLFFAVVGGLIRVALIAGQNNQ
jgi:hypothetical protein